jgi:hypothetical protein
VRPATGIRIAAAVAIVAGDLQRILPALRAGQVLAPVGIVEHEDLVGFGRARRR